jgi:pre-mRNA-processing factor SLU7
MSRKGVGAESKKLDAKPSTSSVVKLTTIVHASVNPHIPAFIAKAPWYVDEGKDATSYLDHQKREKSEKQPDAWYERGTKKGPAATKFRKGACENCGAMSHKVKDCLERPRKVSAKQNSRNIAQDEVIQELDLGWDAKRDRWNGYDASEQLSQIREFEALEEERKRLKAIELEKKLLAAKEGDVSAQKDLLDSDDSDDSDEDTEKVGSGHASKNLRVREDVAKYLVSGTDNANYDPKTRTMRDGTSFP